MKSTGHLLSSVQLRVQKPEKLSSATQRPSAHSAATSPGATVGAQGSPMGLGGTSEGPHAASVAARNAKRSERDCVAFTRLPSLRSAGRLKGGLKARRGLQNQDWRPRLFDSTNN